jgi:ribosomal protein L34E
LHASQSLCTSLCPGRLLPICDLSYSKYGSSSAKEMSSISYSSSESSRPYPIVPCSSSLHESITQNHKANTISKKEPLVETWSWSTKLQLQNLVPIWALCTNLVPKAHVGTKFCNCSLVLQESKYPFSISRHSRTSKVTTPKCGTCFSLVTLEGVVQKFIGRAISKYKRN